MPGFNEIGGAEVGSLSAEPLAIDASVAEYLFQFGLTALPLYTPQTYALPVITYQVSGIDRPTSLAGALTLAKATINIVAWSKSKSEVITLASRLRNAMHGQGLTVFGNTQVQSCILTQEVELYNAPIDSSSQGVYQRVLTFDIWFVESAPTGSGL